MRAALVVHHVLPDPRANLAAILTAAQEAADLVLFPEAALIGLINNDDPAHDLPLGEAIPGAATDALGAMVRQRRIWLGIGVLEREGQRL